MRKTTHHLCTLTIISILFCISVIGCSSKTDIPEESNISNQVTLSWDEVPGASSYNVYFATSPNRDNPKGAIIQNAANPLIIVDLEPGVTYFLAVAAVDAFGEGPKSKEITYRVTGSAGSVKIGKPLAAREQIIFFDVNSVEISKSEIAKLDRFAEYLLDFNRYQVDLNGYSDSAGDIETNKRISKNRADAVKSYLAGKGVESEKIKTAGYGATNFISDNDSADGRSMNRRVEIKFHTAP